MTNFLEMNDDEGMYEEGWTKLQIQKEYHVDPNTLTYWYSKYKEVGDLSVFQNEPQSQVPEDDKIKIVKEILENRLSLHQASIQYSVSICTVKRLFSSYKIIWGDFDLVSLSVVD